MEQDSAAQQLPAPDTPTMEAAGAAAPAEGASGPTDGDNADNRPQEVPSNMQVDDTDAYGNVVKPESDEEEVDISSVYLPPNSLDEEDNNNDQEEAGNQNDSQNDNEHEANPNPFAIVDPLANYECPEPDYTATNALPFPMLVHRLEVLWQQRKRMANKQPKGELLEYLLPRKMLDEYLAGCSPFPLLRLILPDMDSTRPHLGMKEKTIANVWTAAMGLSKESAAYRKLLRFNDPVYAGHTATGDLSVCVKEVIEERFSGKGSKITVGKMNELLDDLQAISRGTDSSASGAASNAAGGGNGSAAHAWRTGGENAGEGGSGAAVPTSGSRPKKNKKSTMQRRIKWVEKLFRLNLSALEHKWVVRLLLGKLEIGVGKESIIKHYHPNGMELFNASNSLKRLCQQLSDPEWVRRRSERDKSCMDSQSSQLDAAHFKRSTEPAELGSAITPMLSKKTSAEQCLSLIHSNYAQYVDSLPKEDPNKGRFANSLAFSFPAFLAEVKMDGERIVVHVNRGIVTIQTRKSIWYSNIYTPVIGPAIRQAISNYDVDCIFDGEIISWDNAKKDVIPFGQNRTVAKARREYLMAHGGFDELDRNLHEGEEKEANIQSVSMQESFIRYKKSTSNILGGDDPGADCWLKFVVFDILYVGGPDAKKLITKSCAHLTPEGSQDYARVSAMSGSIINLSFYHRKAILYELVEEQPNKVEHIEAFVVSSDGKMIDDKGLKDYFMGKADSRYGHPLAVLDSIDCLKKGVAPANLEDIDKERRNNRKGEEIDQERAVVLDKIYTRVVDQECEEGLIFKDLCSEYIFDSRDYWWKIKADYAKLGYASDIDVIVLGANYATGLGKAGILSHFVVGCVDDEYKAKDASDLKVMTLGRCSGGGTARENLYKLLKETGFKPGTAAEEVVYGKWFKCENHYRGVPDFVSKRSFQRSSNGDYNGWKFDHDKYPDLWIRPEDSFVITINAAEVVSSDDYQSGVTLRFPRLSRIRKEGKWKVSQDKYVEEDGKKVEDAISCKEIQDMFYSRDALRQARPSLDAGGQGLASADNWDAEKCRFYTSEQYKKKKRKAGGKRAALVEVGASRIPTPAGKKSKILEGCSFSVLEGSYKLKDGTLDAQEAVENGWYGDAIKVGDRNDVIGFIQKHGGECYLTASSSVDFVVGGEKTDVRVAAFRNAIQSAPLEILNGKLKRVETLRQMMKKGVVKWPFVYAAVNKMIAETRKVKEDDDGPIEGNDEAYLKAARSIKEHNPALLQPRRFDYLVMSRVAEQVLLESEDKYGIHLFETSNEIEFKRALDEVGKEKKRKADTVDLTRKLSKVRGSNGNSSYVAPWQYGAFESLEEEERWVFGGPNQKLWPYQGSSSTNAMAKSPVVLYADLFGDDFGLKQESEVLEEIKNGSVQNRWDAIHPSCETGAVASALPLVKALGAQVTPHLHDGITHILVELSRKEAITWMPGISINVYKDKTIGKALNYRLEELDDEETFSARPGKGEVLLVSPEWVRRQWATE